MSTSHLRLVAAGLSLIVAVLAGLLTGWVSGSGTCTISDQTPAPGSSQPGVAPSGGLDGGNNGGNDPSGNTDPNSTYPNNPNPTKPTDPNSGHRSDTNGFRPPVPSAKPAGGGADAPAMATDAPAMATDAPVLATDAPVLATAGADAPALAATGTCERSFSIPAAVVGFGGALLAGVVVGLLVLYSPRRDAVAPTSGPATTPTGGTAGAAATGRASAVPTGERAPVAAGVSASGSHQAAPQSTGRSGMSSGRQADKERATLIKTCIYVRDRATSKAIADRLAWALHEVGISELSPTGVAFDPSQHEAGGSLPTKDQRLDGTIAAVETTGYADRGEVLRAPVVTVYRADAR